MTHSKPQEWPFLEKFVCFGNCVPARIIVFDSVKGLDSHDRNRQDGLILDYQGLGC